MKIKKILAYWIPMAGGFSLIVALLYLVVQQDIRIGANDPQIQIARDTAASLQNGAAISSLVSAAPVDIAKSLSPYIMVFDEKGKALASSAILQNKLPQIPSGVFDYTRNHNEDDFTWQPQQGVRSAVVVVHYNGKTPGFVLAGKSLTEVEKRESNLEQQVLYGWIIIMGATFILTTISVFLLRKEEE